MSRKRGSTDSSTSMSSALSCIWKRGRWAAKNVSTRSNCPAGKDMVGSSSHLRTSRGGRSGSTGSRFCPEMT